MIVDISTMEYAKKKGYYESNITLHEFLVRNNTELRILVSSVRIRQICLRKFIENGNNLEVTRCKATILSEKSEIDNILLVNADILAHADLGVNLKSIEIKQIDKKA